MKLTVVNKTSAFLELNRVLEWVILLDNIEKPWMLGANYLIRSMSGDMEAGI